jgi:acyl-CoA thioester hydrolase
MKDYRFFHPIQVRYGDIDAQRHVNNAKYFTYSEQGRQHYLRQLGLWDGEDFDSIGIILLEINCRFRSPITLGQRIKVGVRTSRLGNKSLDMDYVLINEDTDREMASGKAVLVAYDYQSGRSMRIPEEWREAITRFEGLDQGSVK